MVDFHGAWILWEWLASLFLFETPLVILLLENLGEFCFMFQSAVRSNISLRIQSPLSDDDWGV